MWMMGERGKRRIKRSKEIGGNEGRERGFEETKKERSVKSY